MRKVEGFGPTTKEEFYEWFDENYADANVGFVETSIQRHAAWCAWQEAYERGFEMAWSQALQNQGGFDA